MMDELNIRDAHPTVGIGGDYFGTSWGDYNNDGAIDFFGSGHWSLQKLYENQQCPNNFLVLTLVGTETNKDAIGVTVKVVADDLEITQTVIAGDGGNNFNNLPLEFGLDQNSTIDYIEIHWINSPTQTITNIAANSFLTVVEGDPVGINVNNKVTFKCYPNPTSGVIDIHYLPTGFTNLKLSVTDIFGRTVFQTKIQDLSGSSTTLDLSDFRTGVYTIQVMIGNDVYSEKVIVK